MEDVIHNRYRTVAGLRHRLGVNNVKAITAIREGPRRPKAGGEQSPRPTRIV
jgi:hypothetical protein